MMAPGDLVTRAHSLRSSIVHSSIKSAKSGFVRAALQFASTPTSHT